RHAGDLPVQAVQGALPDDNASGGPGPDGRPLPAGLIDFGALTYSWAVGELAVTCAALVAHTGATPATAVPAVLAFHRQRPLTAAEVEVLWPLVVLRTAVLVVSGHHQVSLDTGNDYAADSLAPDRARFEQAVSVPMEVMTGLLRHVLGFSPAPVAAPLPQAALLPSLSGP